MFRKKKAMSPEVEVAIRNAVEIMATEFRGTGFYITDKDRQDEVKAQIKAGTSNAFTVDRQWMCDMLIKRLQGERL
jgi:predicted nucleic acid-binding Zn ribbon protein